MINDIRFFKKNRFLENPRILQIEITNFCPLNCPQCYKTSQNKYMNIDFYKHIINECGLLEVKCIMLNGGEPMIHPNIIEMIRYASSKNITTFCFLSGYGINEEKIKALETLKVNIAISLNGSTKEINKQSRDGYEYAINAISLLKHSSLEWGINWVARHDNVKDFENIIDLATKEGALFINIISNKISGETLNSPLNPEDYILLKNIIIRNKDKIRIQVESCFSTLSSFIGNKPPALYKGCGAGIFVCFIDVSGHYQPCSHLPYPEDYDNLSEYWKHSLVLKKLRNPLYNHESNCNTCQNKFYCRFCRAVSYDTSLDFNIGYRDCPVYTILHK